MQGMEWFQQVVQCVARWWFAILFLHKSIVPFGCKLYLRQSLNVTFENLRKCVFFAKCLNWTLVDHFMLGCNMVYLIFRPPKSQRSRNTTNPEFVLPRNPWIFANIFHWLWIWINSNNPKYGFILLASVLPTTYLAPLSSLVHTNRTPAPSRKQTSVQCYGATRRAILRPNYVCTAQCPKIRQPELAWYGISSAKHKRCQEI